MVRRSVFQLLTLLLFPLGLWGQEIAAAPTPESHFGFVPGTDRMLADWHELTGYYERVANASPRVHLDTLGLTTRGLPFVMFTITSPENHARLPELHDTHLRLADPRRIGSEMELLRLQENARTIVLLTSHIHSTEVGAGQMPANLIYRLATSDEPEVLEILDQVVLLHIPSLNPDGTQMIAEWYRRYVGSPFEGAPPVELYHHYVGHDNNRDWYAFTQVETQLAINGAHNVWRPMIVNDLHQMGVSGARNFFPPYTEPFEPNVDPLIIAAINQLGSYMAAELTMQGLTGVVTGVDFDGFSPSRAYQHYHGGVRILSETASALLASPVWLHPEELAGSRSLSVRRPSANFPVPWEGGEWGLPHIVDYQERGVMALLTNAARNRRFWVKNFYQINRRAVDRWETWPNYWVIPSESRSAAGRDALLRILTMGSVEVHRARQSFSAGGRTFREGSYVIPMNQPYASFAQALLEVQNYPDMREYPGGPPIPPYDATAHTLPLLMGVEAVQLTEEIGVTLSPPIANAAMEYAAPAFLSGRRAPKIGIYKGWREPIAAGWTRWLFDQHKIPFASIDNADMRRGNLYGRYDVIILQDQPSWQIREGWRPGEQEPEFTEGIGLIGAEALRQFVRDGGRLVAIESATDLVIDILQLPIGNSVAGLPASVFYIPGSIVRINVDTRHPIGAGTQAENIAWFWRTSRAFDIGHPTMRVVARYGMEPRLSGWVLGARYLAGQPAIVEARVGRGSVVLFGFQPNYRGHSVATWPFLFNALR